MTPLIIGINVLVCKKILENVNIASSTLNCQNYKIALENLTNMQMAQDGKHWTINNCYWRRFASIDVRRHDVI